MPYRRLAIAEELLKQALQPQDIRSPLQGVASVANAGVNGYFAGQAGRDIESEDKAKKQAMAETLMRASKGISGGGFTTNDPEGSFTELKPATVSPVTPQSFAQALLGNADLAPQGGSMLANVLLNQDQRTYDDKVRGEDRSFRTSEREAGQTFTGSQNDASRALTRSEGAAGRAATLAGADKQIEASKNNLQAGREFTADQNRQAREATATEHQRDREQRERIAADKPIPEGQAKLAGFANRMVAADELSAGLEDGGYDPTNVRDQAATKIKGLNGLATDKGQKYRQAQEDFVRAKLRLESGAAIGIKEMDDEIKMYFPQIGDGKEVIEQKRQARARAVENMVVESQNAFPKLFPEAHKRYKERAGNGPAPPEAGTVKDGYRFKGGNPADQNSWEPVR